MNKKRDFSGNGKGLSFRGHLYPSTNSLENIIYEKRVASITDNEGKEIFHQDNIEVPKSWSQIATNVVASKYFYGKNGTSERENSVKQLVHRLARTIADWGMQDGYFKTKQDSENFYRELSGICLDQYASFNSPAWFNIGLHHIYGYSSPSSDNSFTFDRKKRKIVPIEDSYKNPQISACFIQSVDDSIDDIMRLATSEARLFKYGSGTGTDLSTLRSSKEKLSGGGVPSGPVSFMRLFDQIAAVIKSGGKTRRAAKMQSLKISHPDIVEFIKAKTEEEKKAWALIDAGYDSREAYNSVSLQNENLSVRVTDEFMEAVKKDGDWTTRAVTTGEEIETFKARDLMRKIAEGTYICGDPGMQYDTTINKWNTCINSGKINASNPCSEYMFLDNSSCNLASLNLLKFLKENGEFDIPTFEKVIATVLLAQDIMIDRASYPGRKIAENSHIFRPLGLGYANLGALLMAKGFPYDSEEGRSYAAAITGLMTSTAYKESSRIAEAKGAFKKFKENKEPMMDVLEKHKKSVAMIDKNILNKSDAEIIERTTENFERALVNGEKTGFRNAQVTLLAPTGTIGFMMDCDTTGVEPEFGLIKYKNLAGGGVIKIVNKTVEFALRRLGYDKKTLENIIEHLYRTDSIEGAPGLRKEHLPIFDCTFKPQNGSRFIGYIAHIKMMAKIQPFLSGAISKTINVPEDTTIEEIEQAYIRAWEEGLKALAIYRNNSKRIQPLTTQKSSKKIESACTLFVKEGGVLRGLNPNLEEDLRKIEKIVYSSSRSAPVTERKKLPEHRRAITSKLELAGHIIFITVGLDDDGKIKEIFLNTAKEGSFASGVLDMLAKTLSIGLQWGIPTKELIEELKGSNFEPSGYVKGGIPGALSKVIDPIEGRVTSIGDLIANYLRNLERAIPKLTSVFCGEKENENYSKRQDDSVAQEPLEQEKGQERNNYYYPNNINSLLCPKCGHITIPTGRCYKCPNCGESLGCS